MTLSVSLSFIQSAVACCYKGGVVNTNEKQSSFSKHHLLSDKKGKKRVIMLYYVEREIKKNKNKDKSNVIKICRKKYQIKRALLRQVYSTKRMERVGKGEEKNENRV